MSRGGTGGVPAGEGGPPGRRAKLERQAGALAWLPGTDPLRFVLVTSRRRGRWVFPKGAIEPGRTGPETAEREALEEAGVVGQVDPLPLGRFRGRKVRPPRSWGIEVEVYALRIDEVRDAWPEQDERARCFVTISDARVLLDDPEMLRIAERLVAGR